MTSCHDSSNFKDADQYIPERWLNEQTRISARCAEPGVNLVVPFGVGKRQCPGRRFVEMELMLTLAKVSKTKHLFSSANMQITLIDYFL